MTDEAVEKSSRILQYLGDRPTANLMARVLGRPLDPSVAPSAVFRRHSHDPSAQLGHSRRAPGGALADRIIFPGHEPMGLIQQGAGSGQSDNPVEVFEADLFGLGRQPSALGIIEPGFPAQLLHEDLDLLLKILDRILPVAVDPTGRAKEDKLKPALLQSKGFVSGHQMREQCQ